MKWSYDTLLELEGWTFMLEKEGYPGMTMQDYIFLAHTTCPMGVELEVVVRGDGVEAPSVMHYKDLTCQRCNASPPDGLFATYQLYHWGTEAHI